MVIGDKVAEIKSWFHPPGLIQPSGKLSCPSNWVGGYHLSFGARTQCYQQVNFETSLHIPLKSGCNLVPSETWCEMRGDPVKQRQEERHSISSWV